MCDENRHTRRTVLAGAGSILGGTFASGAVTAQNQVKRTMVAQKAELFKGNYVGQFVIVSVVKKKQQSPKVVSRCDGVDWKPNDTRVYDSVFVDRLGNSTQSIRTDIFTDERKSKIEVGQPFIINGATSCTDEYVVLEAESVPVSAATGKPRGPTVTASDNETTRQ